VQSMNERAMNERGWLLKFGLPVLHADMLNGNGADSAVYWHQKQSVRDSVPDLLELLTSFKHRDFVPDVFRGTGAADSEFLFVSEKFRQAVEPWLTDYEFLPVRVSICEGLECDYTPVDYVENYYWLNCWHKQDIIDFEKSDLLAYPIILEESQQTDVDRIWIKAGFKCYSWRQLHLKDEPASDAHLFGLKYVQGATLYLSDALHQHILQQDLKVQFEPRPLRFPVTYDQHLRSQLNPMGRVSGIDHQGWNPMKYMF
jgi:hypothetical protein